jgi:dTDP-4-dehydrorhamnose 3,5-epimerase
MGLYAPDCEHSLRWDDPAIGIDWPVDAPSVSAKDRSAPTLETISRDSLPRYAGMTA